MNTPKTFEPVVTDEGMHEFRKAMMNGQRGRMDAWLEVSNEAEVRAFIRAYAAEVARAMVPPEKSVATPDCWNYSRIRAATLSAIDEWEKGE